jgi:hypothetical protein
MKKPTTPSPYPGISGGGKSRQVAFNTLSPKQPVCDLEADAARARDQAGKPKSNNQHKASIYKAERHDSGKFR